MVQTQKNKQPKRIKVKKYIGVYYREHIRDNDRDKPKYHGRPDRCFDISFKDPNGKIRWEKIGWTSEGYSAEMASQIRGERTLIF